MAPAFTLYTDRGSSNGDRVRLTLAEGGFSDYETVYLSMAKQEQKSPENMKRHPWGKLPSVVFADGFTVIESRAICKYLARRYTFPLLPAASDAQAQALFDQAEAIEMAYFQDSAGKLSFELFAKKRFMKLPPNQPVVDEATKSLQQFFDIAEARLLAGNEYMAGKEFTLVDIYYIPLMNRLFDIGMGDIVSSRKNVSSWWERVSHRPAVRQLLDADRKAAAAAMAAMSK